MSVYINELLLDVALNSWQKSNVIKTLGVSFFFKGQDTQTSWGKDQTSGNTSLLNKVHLICISLLWFSDSWIQVTSGQIMQLLFMAGNNPMLILNC